MSLQRLVRNQSWVCVCVCGEFSISPFNESLVLLPNRLFILQWQVMGLHNSLRKTLEAQQLQWNIPFVICVWVKLMTNEVKILARTSTSDHHPGPEREFSLVWTVLTMQVTIALLLLTAKYCGYVSVFTDLNHSLSHVTNIWSSADFSLICCSLANFIWLYFISFGWMHHYAAFLPTLLLQNSVKMSLQRCF